LLHILLCRLSSCEYVVVEDARVRQRGLRHTSDLGVSQGPTVR
jgi:hypothetical protein